MNLLFKALILGRSFNSLFNSKYDKVIVMNFITINVRFECMVVKYKKKYKKRKDPFPQITPLYLTPLPSHLNKITFSFFDVDIL